jgi:hypothetical protein
VSGEHGYGADGGPGVPKWSAAKGGGELVYDVALVAVERPPSDAEVAQFTDAEREAVITTYYNKYDSKKTAQQIKDILAKPQCVAPTRLAPQFSYNLLCATYPIDRPWVITPGTRPTSRSSAG